MEPELILALFLGLIPATIAKNKGRSFGRWYVYGVLLFIVALIHSLLISKKSTTQTEPEPQEPKKEASGLFMQVKSSDFISKAVAVFVVLLFINACLPDKPKDSTTKVPKTEEVPALNQVEIIDKRGTTNDYSDYIDIEGSVRNKSYDKTIDYIMLRYEALDNNNKVIDSNSIMIYGDIKPQEQKIFRSTEHWKRNVMTGYRLYVKDAYYKK